MDALRRMFAEQSPLNLSLMDNSTLIDALVAKVTERELDVLFRTSPVHAGYVGGRASAGGATLEVEERTAPARRPKTPEAEPVPAPQYAQPPDHSSDLAAQAQALRTGAAHGIPFCEICEQTRPPSRT
jgi:hypothetical protein